MRFTVIGPVFPYRGGIAHYTAQLIQAMADAGHTVQTISFKRQYPKWLYPGVSDKDPSSPAIKIDALYLLDPLNPITWWSAAAQVKKHRPQLVLIQWWTTFWAPAFICLGALLKLRKVKVGFIIHNVLPHEQRFFDPWLAKMALSQGKVYLAQTEREKDKLLQLLPERQVKICPLPVYTYLSSQQISKEDARLRLGLPQNQPLVLFFGIVRPYKGLKYLIDAIGIIIAGRLGVKPILLIVGEIWEDKAAYQEQIDHLNLRENVLIDDRYIPDEEAVVIMSAADLLVAPYIDGTQSAAAGMALGFGLPLVVTEIVAGGISENNKRNIKIVKAGDAEALADAIGQVLSDPKLMKRESYRGVNEWQELVTSLEGFG